MGCCVLWLPFLVLGWFFYYRDFYCLGGLFVSLAGCCFCPIFVPLRPVRYLVWGCLPSMFSVASASITLSSVLAHPFVWGCQRHAPPFKITFEWGFLCPLFGGRSAPVPRGASPPPFSEPDKLNLLPYR